MQRRDQVVLAALVVGLLIGAAATYALVGGRSRTSTSTTTLAAVTRTSTAVVTVRQTNEAVATAGLNGTLLSASINATDLTGGESLGISISLSNTLSTNNTLPKANDWPFYGVPLATWIPCGTEGIGNQPIPGWPLPIDVVVIWGNYSAQELPSVANASFGLGGCGYIGSFPFYTFEPNSDVVNITAEYSASPGIDPVGLFQLSSHFTVTGDWNLTALSERSNMGPVTVNGTTSDVPVLVNDSTNPASTPFSPGVYTVGVADEWGQSVVLHFQVSGPP